MKNKKTTDQTPGQMVTIPDGPMGQMILAKQAGFNMTEIKEMMDLQDRNDKTVAKKAFDSAMAEFKKNPPRIVKDCMNDQFGSGYTSIGNMVNTVNEAMGPFGLNARWTFPESTTPDFIKVTCILAHELGHQIEVTLEGPIIVQMTKTPNPIQGRKAARTYLKLETFEAVTGMASVSGNVDDDANSVAVEAITLISEDQVNTIHSMIKDNGLDMDLFTGWFTKRCACADMASIPENFYDIVIAKINATIDATAGAAK